MGNQYGVTAVQRVYENNLQFIKDKIVRRLMWKYNIREYTEQDFLNEVTFLFFMYFYKYYETDQQYLSMVYVFGKNHILTVKKAIQTHGKYVTTDRTQIACSIGLQIEDESRLNNVLEEVRDPKEHFAVDIQRRDTVRALRAHVGEEENTIIDLILMGLSIKDICSQLGISSTTLLNRKIKMRKVLCNI